MVSGAADVPGAIAEWAQNKIQEIDTATEAVNTADTASETDRDSAQALAESGKDQVQEARGIAEDYHDGDQPE
jgi:hypothetical protein